MDTDGSSIEHLTCHDLSMCYRPQVHAVFQLCLEVNPPGLQPCQAGCPGFSRGIVLVKAIGLIKT